MKKTRAASALLLMATAALAHAEDIPRTFPRFDLHKAGSAVVVARVSAGAELPELEECTRPNTICLHSPFWFRAQGVSAVSGHVGQPELIVSTLSHYGLASFLRPPTVRLLSLRTFQGQVYMPVNAWKDLATRRDGELFLVDYMGFWPTWLPCATPQLRETLDERAFAEPLRIEPDEYRSYEVEEHRDMFDITPQGAFPRYGISISRLRTLMTTLSARGAPTDCPRSDD